MSASWQQVTKLDLIAVDNGLMAYDEARDCVHYLNPTAALVLMLCNGANTLDEIAAALQAQFGLDEQPKTDAAEILARFVEEGLVIPADARATGLGSVGGGPSGADPERLGG